MAYAAKKNIDAPDMFDHDNTISRLGDDYTVPANIILEEKKFHQKCYNKSVNNPNG